MPTIQINQDTSKITSRNGLNQRFKMLEYLKLQNKRWGSNLNFFILTMDLVISNIVNEIIGMNDAIYVMNHGSKFVKMLGIILILWLVLVLLSGLNIC